MSAGELESGNAGEPAKLIRQRYREASDVIKKVRFRELKLHESLTNLAIAPALLPSARAHP